MLKKYLILLQVILLFALTACTPKKENNFILIKGGTIINTDWDASPDDNISNAYILIQDKRIIKTGIYSDTVSLPKKYTLVDASGKYIIPGLIDGFAVINNQAYANAFLLSGVTSVIGVSSTRRGELFETGNPSPRIFKLGEAGDEPVTNDEIIKDFEQSFSDSIKVMLLMYKLNPDQLKLCMKLADKYNMATIGELGFTSYKDACEIGVEAFVHTTRYSLDIAPEALRKAVTENPFSNDLNSAKWKYYRFLTNIDTSNKNLINHAKVLANSNSYLMPTLSLLYLDLPDHNNPWNEPVATLINENDINNPADKLTGNHSYSDKIQNAYTNLALKELQIDKIYSQSGAKYLSGSATDVWGTMPGISLHTELELLERVGLKPEQVLASATSNFSEAFNWDIGKLETGFVADILILNNNPLDNLKDINALFLRGKEIDLSELSQPENQK
ncbi:MAG: amidohydrolase family protein [Bacteroidales bacterium]|nr:amidohydrolase family protein [Bacteroidales bacterium]